MPAPPQFPQQAQQPSYPALYLYPLNDTFVPKHICLAGGQRIKIGRQTNAKSVPGERNGYFDSKVLSRQHAEVWEEANKIFIKDVKSSNGTFINGERLSPESVESEPFELKSDDIVEFGIDIIGEDNKTVLHHKVAARIVCVLTEEDVQIAARVEQMHASSSNSNTSPSATSPSHMMPQQNNFSFQQQGQPQRRPTLQNPALGGMGGMANMRPPGKGGLTFDHILSRLQGELQKSRDTGTELHSLSNAMSDVRDTLGGQLPPNLPHYPSSLPPVRAPQEQSAHSSESGEPAPDSTSSSGLAELRSELCETQSSLASYVTKVSALEDVLAEHEAIKTEMSSLRDLMEERKRDMVTKQEDEQEEHDEEDFDDAASISTIIPHELERVEEEDEEGASGAHEAEETDDDRRRRREELGRPRTPEPGSLGMLSEDSSASGETRRRSNTGPSSKAIDDLMERLTALSTKLESAIEVNSELRAQHASAQTTIQQLESKVGSLEALVVNTQERVRMQEEEREREREAAAKAPPPEPEPKEESERESLTALISEWKKTVEGQWSTVREEWTAERDRLAKARDEWEGKIRTLESGLELRISSSIATQVSSHLQNGHFLPHGDIKIGLNGTHGGGLVTPPSPVSVASNGPRSKGRKRRGRAGGTGSRSTSQSPARSLSPVSPMDLGNERTLNGINVEGLAGKKGLRRRRGSHSRSRSRSVSPSIDENENEDSEAEMGIGPIDSNPKMRYPFTPDPSIGDSSSSGSAAPKEKDELELEDSMTSSAVVEAGRKGYVSDGQIRTAMSLFVVGVATAVVLWRVKPDSLN
ncbi:hypothetical protein CONPUDRAFT_139331 [Coniophora puteana RWD-64-598 SS2]|uniref:FHA domain-containing protein n=1 Tax=Coniophora puteana (strain RWD-64-598) TaxID=741705 RepID=A0A5M3MFA0_CONPW|nr:uncharacterized protein CONPUDRAFT_139331 [Coniophora puteana RWD-64-598 SS2]EIW77464.1 hypothetical protein CONPUDRAFT_139331 [Coniophora puteana RWD-64-598 SS2]